jgi:hypothetical protein
VAGKSGDAVERQEPPSASPISCRLGGSPATGAQRRRHVVSDPRTARRCGCVNTERLQAGDPRAVPSSER